MHRPLLVVFALMLLAPAGPVQADEYEFEWPDSQGSFQPGPSDTEIKAKKPRIKLIPPAEGTRPDRAKFSGYWEGYMCGKRSVDVNVFVHEVTDKDANMRYSVASEHFDSLRGGFVRRRTAKFRGDVLILKMGGADIIVGMRPDGHMNIKWDADKSGRGWCTGVMQRTLSPPVRNEAEKDEPSSRSSRSASDGTRGR